MFKKSFVVVFVLLRLLKGNTKSLLQVYLTIDFTSF